MVIFGDKTLPVYEVEFEVLNVLTKNWEHKWDYVHAVDSWDAKQKINWIYGQMVEFLSVEGE